MSSTGVAAPAARPARRRALLPAGWPVLALFALFPLWWFLGLAAVIWVVLAVPMLVQLLLRGSSIRIPKGFGLWAAFLFWMLLSGTQLDEARRLYAFSYRALLYLASTVMFLYVYNLPRSAVPARKVVLALTIFWAVVICLGFVALVIPNARFTTPAALLLPGNIGSNPFVQDLFDAKLAQVQDFIGYDLPRPAAPFTYTNEWGGAVGLLTPMALAGLGMLHSYLARNGLVTLTPLEHYVSDRLANQHSNERRESLGEQAIQGTLDAPLFGHGGPRESQETPNAPEIGTHGHVYLVAFSHGIPGIAFFLGWWLWALLRTSKGATGPPLWCHVVLVVGMLEFFYYDMMPTQLHLMMVVSALAWRELEAAAGPAERETADDETAEAPSPLTVR